MKTACEWLSAARGQGEQHTASQPSSICIPLMVEGCRTQGDRAALLCLWPKGCRPCRWAMVVDAIRQAIRLLQQSGEHLHAKADHCGGHASICRLTREACTAVEATRRAASAAAKAVRRCICGFAGGLKPIYCSWEGVAAGASGFPPASAPGTPCLLLAAGAAPAAGPGIACLPSAGSSGCCCAGAGPAAFPGTEPCVRTAWRSGCGGLGCALHAAGSSLICSPSAQGCWAPGGCCLPKASAAAGAPAVSEAPAAPTELGGQPSWLCEALPGTDCSASCRSRDLWKGCIRAALDLPARQRHGTWCHTKQGEQAQQQTSCCCLDHSITASNTEQHLSTSAQSHLLS